MAMASIALDCEITRGYLRFMTLSLFLYQHRLDKFNCCVVCSTSEQQDTTNKNREGFEYVGVLQDLQKEPRSIQKGTYID